MTPDEVNPFVSPEEQEKLKQLVREAANEGVFTPSSHLRPHIQFPGAWGGANWGSTAGDPETGMLYVRSLEMISYRKMSLVDPAAGRGRGRRTGSRAAPPGAREQQGQNVYMQRCSGCHGPGQMPMRSLKVIGPEGFRSVVRKGVNQMPPFPTGDDLERRARGARVVSVDAADKRRAGGQPRARFGFRRIRTDIKGLRRVTADRFLPAGIRATAIPSAARRGRSSSPTI